MPAEEAYQMIRRPEWQWNNEFYKGPPVVAVGGQL